MTKPRRLPKPGDQVTYLGQQWFVTQVNATHIQLFGGSRGYPTVSVEGPWMY